MMTVNEAFGSKIHAKIIIFFHENQASIDTPRGVATWIGEEREGVKNALEDLVKIKVLVAHRSTSTTGYSYTRDQKIISRIQRLLNNKT